MPSPPPKRKKIDYDNLTEVLIYSDIPMPDETDLFFDQSSVEIMKKLTIEFVENAENALIILNSKLSTLSDGKQGVSDVMFVLYNFEITQIFIDQFNNLITTCKKKFPQAQINLGLSDADKVKQVDSKFPADVAVTIFYLDENKKTKNLLLKENIRHCYTRCHHQILCHMKNRCRDGILFRSENDDDFVMINGSTSLFFKRNKIDRSYFIYDNTSLKNAILILNNNHLHALYNPGSLFNLYSVLKLIREVTQSSTFKIEKREIRFSFFPYKISENDSKTLFEKVISKLDEFQEFFSIKHFKIQLGQDYNFILNRCLKISLQILNYLLEKNLLEPLMEMASAYFSCFSIAPICCRMQSLAVDANVYDFEKFSYLHIDKHRSLYIEMCKILFPCTNGIEEKFLKKVYLEVLPVTLIKRFHGKKLENFIKVLQKLQDLNICVIPLANGNFQIGTYFNISAEMLSKIKNVGLLKNADEKLQICSKKFEFNLVTAENLNCNSTLDFEKVVFQFREVSVKVQLEVKSLPDCDNKVSCYSKFPSVLYIFTYGQHNILAYWLPKNENILLALGSMLSDLGKDFAEAFDETITSFRYFTPVNTALDLKHFLSFKENGTSGTILLDIPFYKRDLWLYNERFVFDAKYSNSQKSKFVEVLQSFEKYGILFAFVKDKIILIEDFDKEIAELNRDHYKATADYCFYEEENIEYIIHLMKAFENKVSFEITNFGAIRINGCIEFRPNLLCKIYEMKNLEKFLSVAVTFSQIQTINAIEWNTFPISFFKNTSEITSISIAKKLNPLLQSVKNDKLFLSNNFKSIPIHFNGEYIDKLLTTFRNEKISVQIINNCYFTRNYFQANFSSEDVDVVELLELQEIIENINAEYDGIVIITTQGQFTQIDYENFEEHIFRQICAPPTKDASQCVKQCLKLFQQTHIVKTVSICNDLFFINNATLVQANTLAKLSSNAHNSFFRANAIVRNFFLRSKCMYADNWITLAEKKQKTSLTKEILKNKKFTNFSILDDEKCLFLKLAKIVNKNLSAIPDVELMSYEWLELIPRQFVMEKHKAEELLALLTEFQNSNIYVTFNSSGAICIHKNENWVLMWVLNCMQIKCANCFVNFLDYIKAFSHFSDVDNNNEYIDQTKVKPYSLETSGLFSSDEIKSIILEFHMRNNQEIFERITSSFIKEIEEKNNKLMITIDSGVHIMLGNFIYGYVSELLPKCSEFFQMVNAFEKAVALKENDLMKSIKELVIKSEFDRKQAIRLAKVMNRNLENFSDNIICHENVKIFPADLWNACNDNSKTYEIAINMFEWLKINKIRWIIQLKGTVELQRIIVVNVKDLLDSYSNSDEATPRAQLLKDLIDEILWVPLMPLYCENAIRNSERGVGETKVSSFAEVVKAKDELKLSKNKCRIEPNGTLFINNILWVKKEDALEKRYETINVSEKLKKIFQNARFQYGFLQMSILTSVLTSTEEQLYEYCYNMCQLINEKYSDIKIVYNPDGNLFKFNDFLSIHPRSFFHLQDMDNVVKVIKKFNMILSSRNEANPELDKNEKEFWKEIHSVMNQERVEFEEVRKNVFQRLGKILWEKKAEISFIGNINDVLHLDEKDYYGIEGIVIGNEHIFKEGISNIFIKIDTNGCIKYDFKKEHIIDALKFIDYIKDMPQKCKNFSDFESVIEIIIQYKKFPNRRKDLDFPNDLTSLPRYEQICWWMKEVQNQQDKPWKFKYLNVIKGLAHWFKHDSSFKNLEDYYNTMNKFFENNMDYTLELDTQNGEFMNHRFDASEYFGVHMIAHEDSGKKDFIATFFYKPITDKLKNLKLEDKYSISYYSVEPCKSEMPMYLIITDTDFSKYYSNINVTLNSDIGVLSLLAMKFRMIKQLTNYLQRTKFVNSQKVVRLLLFLPKILKNELPAKKKNSDDNAMEIDIEERQSQSDNITQISHTSSKYGVNEKTNKRDNLKDDLSNLKTILTSKFSASRVTLCYPPDLLATDIEILKKNFHNIIIPEKILKNNDAQELNEFMNEYLRDN